MKTDYAALHWVYEIHGQWSTHPLQCRIFPHTMDWTCAGAEAAWVHGLWCSGSMSAQSIMFRVNECTVGLWCPGSMLPSSQITQSPLSAMHRHSRLTSSALLSLSAEQQLISSCKYSKGRALAPGQTPPPPEISPQTGREALLLLNITVNAGSAAGFDIYSNYCLLSRIYASC